MNKVAQIVTDKILQRMETAKEKKEKFYWVKPFAEGAPDRPYSYGSQAYTGINRLLLDNTEYLTFNKIQELNKGADNAGYHIRQGAHGNMVCYFNTVPVINSETGEPEIDEVTGKEKRKGFLKYYNVFSREDVITNSGKNLPSKFEFQHYTHEETTENMRKSLDRFNRLFNYFCQKYKIGIETITDGIQAYFCNNMTIRVPSIENFHSLYQWVHTMAHEMSHATGVMLGRFENQTIESEEEQMQSYSREELVAELSAEMLCAELHIPDDSDTPDNSVAYISGWSSYLKDRPNEIITAASKAEKASDLIMQCLNEMELEEQKAKSVNKMERNDDYVR